MSDELQEKIMGEIEEKNELRVGEMVTAYYPSSLQAPVPGSPRQLGRRASASSPPMYGGVPTRRENCY